MTIAQRAEFVETVKGDCERVNLRHKLCEAVSKLFPGSHWEDIVATVALLEGGADLHPGHADARAAAEADARRAR